MAIRATGGYFFAEDPGKDAHAARILWNAEHDPAILMVEATPAAPSDPEALTISRLSRWLTLVPGVDGVEHAVLSDGWHRIRLDVVKGTLSECEAVRLRFHLDGLASTEVRLLPLRRLIGLHRHRRFGPSLYPLDRKMNYWISILRVRDALEQGASQRDIATALFGAEHVRRGWRENSESIRSRVRRLVREAGRFTAGTYRELLRANGTKN